MRFTFPFLIFFLVTASALADDAVEGKAPHFDVMEYQIEGNTVLPAITVEEVVYPWLGESKTVADVEHARENLERAYHEAGYSTVLVDIPEQKVESGIVQLKVTEGTVGRVRVLGSRYFSQGRIISKMPSIAEGSVPYFPDLQKEIAGVNAMPDRQVGQILRPGKRPGTVDVDLRVEDKLPLHGSLELNNHAGPSTKSLRAIGSIRYDNLWQREHSLSLQYQTAPEDQKQVKVLSASYTIPLSAQGDMLAMYAVRSRSDVAAIGESSVSTVLGNGNIYGIRRIVPLPSRDQYFHSLSLGVDYKDFQEDIMLHGADSLTTPISYLPFTVSYNATALGADSLTLMNMSANFSLRGVGNKEGQFENKRFLAQPNYFYLKADVTHTRKIFGDFSMTAKLSGQTTSQPLISNEQFSAGGADSVRGYLESEALGDDAVQGGLELSSPSAAGALPDSIDELRLLAFAEGSLLTVRDALPNQQNRFLLSSVGVGLRLKAVRHFTTALDVGWPLKDTVNTRSGHARVHFKMAYEF